MRTLYLLLTIAGIATLGCNTTVSAAPYVPQDGREVLERLRDRPLDPTARELRKLRSELTQQPQNLPLAMRISQRYVDEARAQGDPRYLGYAQGALAPWWSLPKPPNGVLLLRATIKQSNHDFDSALSDLAQAIKAAPANVPAWLMRANLLQLKGEYEGALESCQTLTQLTGDFVSGTCLASIDSVTGHAEESYRRLRRLLESTPDATPAQTAWVQTALAEIATRLGLQSEAENHFKRALQQGRPDPYLKASYADFLLDAGRPAEVARLLTNDTRIDALLLRLALADQALGSPQLQSRIASLQARFDAARGRGDRIHLREEARFYTTLLKAPAEGLLLAQANWKIQKEPADARVLLESALAAGQPGAALPVLAWMRMTKLQDASLERLVRRMQQVS